MLTPSYLLHATEPAEEIAEKLHIDIINRIIERIQIRFDRGDNYILTPLDKWQLETLQQAGYLLEDIQEEIAAATGLMTKEVAEAMEDAGVRALEYDDAIYREAGLDPVPMVQSPYMIQLMQRDYEATMGEWENFTRISKNAIHSLFVNTCDTAYHQAITGMISPSQAVREALETIIEGGAYVEYRDQKTNRLLRRDTIETATARAVRTGISQSSAKIQLARMDEFDVDLVIVSSHLGARPEHQVWQGKIYSRSGGGDYPDFVESTRYGYVDGLCGANCRHNFSPWFEGQGNPFEQYDSEENLKQYELEQRQRTMERRIRNTKRQVINLKAEVDTEKDPERKEYFERKYQKKAALLQQQNTAYNQFCEETGQKKQYDRIQIAKWDRSQAAKARAAAKMWNDEHREPSVDNQKVANKINYNPNTIDRQYKETEAMNEYDYFSSDQEKFRIESIKKMAGYDDFGAMKALDALCGTSAEYRGIGVNVPTGWFSGADNQIRLATDGEFFEKAKIIDEYIDRSPKYKGSIYRGLALDDETISMFSVGGTFRENGNLSSWTSDPSVASMFAEGRSEELGKKPIIFRTKDPKHGTPAAHLSIFGSEENEVLVSNMKDSEYIIEAVTENDGMIVVDMILKGG